MLLDNIALIASAVSAVTAVTTSLRALGKSRENARDALRAGAQTSGKHGIPLYLAVTIVWLALSVVFAAPVLVEKWSGGVDMRFFLGLLPFVLLGVLLCIIWWKILRPSSPPRS
ncbi:MAG: hypothetical protein GXP46_10210 [Deferribacteres bacterium]|nr:hypothetical protein [Deferribacteres bacterium]